MKYNHALFLNPYTDRRTTTSTITRLFPPTGLEFVAASARDLVGKLTLIDLRYEEPLRDTDKLIDFIKKEVNIICVGIGWDKEFDDVCALLNRMPDNIPLVVGGHKATEEVEELFVACPNIDIIVRGEGEETIKEIMSGVAPKDILGISYRENGQVIHNENRPLPDVDIIASPDRSLRRNKYSMMLHGKNITGLTYDTILSARGCPFNCKFCTFSLNPLGQKRPYAARSVESVIKELKSIEADFILFSDDNFATDAKRAMKICDLIIENKINKRFLAQVRIEIAEHPELLKKMVQAGFKMVSLGIESPHDRILAEFNKGFDSAKIRRCFKVLNKFPIFYHGYFIYGNIGETEEEMLYISKFAQEIGLDTIACNKLRVSKYSPLKKTFDNMPDYHLTEKGEVYSDKYSHSDLKKINKRIKHSFYSPLKILKIIKKFLAARFISPRELLSVLSVAPLLIKDTVARELEKSAARKKK